MCITGHIYKIIHLDSEIQYIGSTCDSISGRWRTHKSAYKNWLNDKEKYSEIAIYPWFERYCIDRFKMILIKSYIVYDKTQLKVYEQLAINRTKCCNTNAALQLVGRKCMTKHFSILYKQYREANREKFSERDRIYRTQNKEKIKEYRDTNRDKSKAYYQSNKQNINEQKKIKVTCECGTMIRKSDISAHRKTQKHLTLLVALSN